MQQIDSLLHASALCDFLLPASELITMTPFQGDHVVCAGTDAAVLSLHVCAVLQLGHCPQEDYPEAIQGTLEAFLVGETDSWPMGKVVASKMTKKGLMEA